MSAFSAALDALEAPGGLDDSALGVAFAQIMDGAADDAGITRFLIATQRFMQDPNALAIGAQALRARMIPLTAPSGAIDVCGTGGDGAHTLNVSTAVAFVVAGAGAPVAKHGNRAMSSRSGAADVLEALGVTLTGERDKLERALREAKVAFLFAQNHHPAMRHVAPARRALGQRTIFNLLGPLANPASVKRQLVGVFAPEFVIPMVEALKRLGAECAAVVHGAGGLDEYSFIDDPARRENRDAFLSIDGDIEDNTDDFESLGATAARLGAKLVPASALAGGDAAHNAQALRALLDNRLTDHAYEHTVLINAMAALVIAGATAPGDGLAGWAMAKDSLRSGRALAALEALIAITRVAP